MAIFSCGVICALPTLQMFSASVTDAIETARVLVGFLIVSALFAKQGCIYRGLFAELPDYNEIP